jgi:hypothetical protein
VSRFSANWVDILDAQNILSTMGNTIAKDIPRLCLGLLPILSKTKGRETISIIIADGGCIIKRKRLQTNNNK